MAVLINCFILCVWQFSSVRPAGVSLPITSITYKASPINPKSLSLSFSINDSMDSKNNLEDFKPIKSSLSAHNAELSKKMVSVSKLLSSQLGLISDNYSTPKDFNFLKQKPNVDPNILYEVASPPQKNVPYLRTNSNEKNYVSKDLQNKKNPVNYNIKVISPPAVFNNLPVTQNVAGSKIISETNKYSNNVPPSLPSLLPYPLRIPTEEGKQEPTAVWQNIRKTFTNNEDGTKYKIVEPLVRKNTINIAEHDEHLIRNIVKNEDIIAPKANAKRTCDLNVNKTPFDIDPRPNNLFGYNCHQIKYLDTSYIQNHNTLPTMSDIIKGNHDIKPLSTYATEIMPKLSSHNLPEISKPQQIYSSEYDTYNLQLGSSLDNIVSFLKSLLSAPESLHPHIANAPVKSSKKPVFVSTYPEVESPTYLPKPNIDIPLKHTDSATKKSITKSPIPYISSVTINYMPCGKSSNEIMIFV